MPDSPKYPEVRKWKVGDRVRFRGMERPSTRVIYVVSGGPCDGMVEIASLPGQFAPHLFVAAEPAEPKPAGGLK